MQDHDIVIMIINPLIIRYLCTYIILINLPLNPKINCCLIFKLTPSIAHSFHYFSFNRKIPTHWMINELTTFGIATFQFLVSIQIHSFTHQNLSWTYSGHHQDNEWTPTQRISKNWDWLNIKLAKGDCGVLVVEEYYVMKQE